MGRENVSHERAKEQKYNTYNHFRANHVYVGKRAEIKEQHGAQ